MVIQLVVVVLLVLPFVRALETVKQIEHKRMAVGGRCWDLGEEGGDQIIECGWILNWECGGTGYGLFRVIVVVIGGGSIQDFS